MGYQLSPGVNVSELDLTTIVPSVSTTAGAFAGTFKWGPVNQPITVDSELTLSKTFGTPDSNSAVSFFTGANFLAYGNNLNVVRAAGPTCYNATANSDVLAIASIDNKEVFQDSYLMGDNLDQYGPFVARYRGALGNSLSVAVCDTTNSFVGWAYAGYFPSAPTTSDYCSGAGGANDEIHLVVVDSGGLFTGTKGTVVETYPFISKAVNAIKTNDGTSNYYRQVIFDNSNYIYSMGPVNYADSYTTWDGPASTNFYSSDSNYTVTLVGGNDEIAGPSYLEEAYSLFKNKDTIDISLVLTGDASVAVQQYVIDNIVISRQDCVAFLSPPKASVVNQGGNETTNIQTWLDTLARSTSYAVVDSGWKYQFDLYNNVYRWIPLNADVAGLCVYTDTIRDPWFSPAGFNRGAIKNAIKLAWNPRKTYRDILYSAGVNPVVSFPGQGIVLFGDKTLQAKPSAFDRINVRRLFIILEKAIAKAAQYSLFEFNDEFTRAQFVAMVNPFLRDVKGRRGVTDFKVVCDTTNNTPQVIDSNQFVGDIYIKPNRSINFIQLNFIAVGTGVDFNTVIGVA